MTDTRKFIKALSSAHVSALKARSDIEALGGKLRGIVQKVDTQAQWFADGISKGN
jgi:hypothetical protein